METLIEENKNDDFKRKFYVWHLERLQALVEPVMVETTILKSYIGNYGPRKISLKDNNLYYQKGGAETQYKLIPLNNHYFMVKGDSSFRLKFMVENGQTLAIEGHYDNGRSDKNLKTKN